MALLHLQNRRVETKGEKQMLCFCNPKRRVVRVFKTGSVQADPETHLSPERRGSSGSLILQFHNQDRDLEVI